MALENPEETGRGEYDLTIIDQIQAYTRSIIQSVVDKEPLNYLEAAGLYAIVLQSRHSIAMLCSLYNQAQDTELRTLIKDAIYEQTLPVIEKCESLMNAGKAEIPKEHFPSPILYEEATYPKGVRLTDIEIAIALGNIARTAQFQLFTAMQQCYQLEISIAINLLITSSLQWSFRLLQLMLHRGWLPVVPKIACDSTYH